MRNKYNCITGSSITKAILLALIVMLSNFVSAQQSPSIQTGVTFEWADNQANNSSPANIQSVTIDGTIYNTFVVPTSYEMTIVGNDGPNRNNIRLNGVVTVNNSDSANWVSSATSAFQDKNLNHYFESISNGENFCNNFDELEDIAEEWEDGDGPQKQTIFYSPAIPSNEGGVFAVTERGGNNCFYIEVWGTPMGDSTEQKLGETFVRNSGNYQGCVFGPPSAGSDYWQSGRCNENGQTIGIALFYLDDVAPTGSKITRIEFVAATNDHGDGKFFILQKYAVDQNKVNCIDQTYSDDLDEQNNVPSGSTYSLVSGPTPAGQSFTLNADGSYNYVPTPGFVGDVVFDYEVCLPAPNTSVCDTGTVTISYIDLPSNPTFNISCSDTNVFVLTVESPLGTDYEYSIDGGNNYQDEPEFSNLSQGTYNLIVRNKFFECPTSFGSNPIIIEDLEISGSVTNVQCSSEANGSIDITVSGGATPYSYSWSNSATTEDLTNVVAGIYEVTVTDVNGCIISEEFSISQPPQELSATVTNTTNVDCSDDTNGSFTINAEGGTSPYQYSLDSGLTTQSTGLFENLSDGFYDVLVTDINNCTTSVIAEITLLDNENPIISVPSEISIEGCSASDITSSSAVFDLNEYGSDDVQSIFSSNPNYNASDDLNIDSITYNDIITSSDDCPVIVIRSFTVTDSCGNSATTLQTITVQDTTAPLLTIPEDITVECDQDIPPINDIIQSESIINSNNYFIANSEYEVSAWFKPANTNNYEPRNITIPNNLGFGVDGNVSGASGELGANETGTEVIRIDFNDPQLYIDVTFGWKNPNEDALITFYLNNQQIGTSKRHYGGNDSVNNPILFTTDDNSAFDRIEFTAPFTSEDSGHDYLIHTITFKKVAPEFISATGIDTCGTVTITGSDVETAACGNTKTIVRTWTATDVCGNSVSADQTITVVDTTPPTIAVPADITIECSEDESSANTGVATGADTCGTVTITESDVETAACGNTKTIVRTWTVTNECGNSVSADQTITVVDTTPPTFNESLPADIDAECDAVPEAEALTVSDNCGDATITFEEEITNGACIGDYIIERTWTATDSCGNEAVHTQIITVQDTTAPALVTPLEENITVACDDIPDVPNLVFQDECSNNIAVDFEEVSTQQNNFEDYQLIRTWTVTDDCGNIAEFVQNISVEISNLINVFTSNRCVLDTEFDLFNLLSGDFDMNGIWSVVSGNATLNGSLFDPSSVDVGIYTFMYSITDGLCPTGFEVNITIDDDCEVLPCGSEDVVISKTVTANGDNYNEFFTITGVEDCGFIVELQIFNRWGAEIYKNNNYQNDWNGDAHGSSVGASGKVPTGTYYYVINLRNSGLKPFAGPIYVATDK
ncbi:MAG: gliding motility-associated C-terminal domain-containing protein [Winogradskyella sp.]|uniref:T9SS type B sorting domain-containing protein n=1 Tax=Winogradskyella sp. TaxID=1883156 RepID=UPI0025F557E9|nr:gliding motility-associated C-terminal domain-containing protein [Winogradskyella sp.]NRB82624.1 gliding motility-associated C-terminal domain-containing protein [Winogradskyella sp.]